MSDWSEKKKTSSLESEYNTRGIIIGGAVLVVIILVLCFLIWNLYHKEEGPGSGNTPQINQPSEGESDTLGSGHGDEDDSFSPDETQDTDETESSDIHEGQGSSQDDTQEGQDGSQASSAGQGNEDQGGGQGGQSGGTGEGTGSDTPSMDFADVDETVTAKETTNLRSAPGTTEDDTVVTKLRNGETAKRTGINEETGWSRLEYNGQTLYAVSRLLTTDLSDKPAEEKPSNTVTTASGRKITFTPCDDVVSPKIECNLRTEPSTDQGEQSVSYLLKYGEKVHRTGYDVDSGWSRVEYNGATLYLVSSLVYVVEETPESEGTQ